MNTTTKTLPALVHDFFERHLAVERNAGRHTIAAYRDALKLFLHWAAQTRHCTADQLDDTVLTAASARDFLRWLEQARGSSPRSRNQRLAVLKSFVRYVASIEPQHLEQCRAIREIPHARVEHPEPPYLDEDETVQLLHSVATARGQRDRALLLLLYNTGARVQEIVDLNVENLHDAGLAFVRLRGKGRKQRTCPLWQRTVTAVQAWLQLRGTPAQHEPLFLNARGQRLTRSGVAYILQRAQSRAALEPRHAQRLTPHVVRHTTAMHLLRSGVDITTIAAWLGHADLSTTHAYVQIDLRMKQQALATLAAPPELSQGEFPSDALITWLERIGRPSGYVQHEPIQAPSHRSPPTSLHITQCST
jgi:site-specific recombinase XerD